MTQPNKLNLRRLGTIGARGMVVHADKRARGHYAFFADNKRETWREFPITDIATFAQEHGFDEGDLEILAKNSVPIAVMKAHHKVQGKTVLVNLDTFHDLAKKSPDDDDDGSKDGRYNSQVDNLLARFGVLLIRENGKYYQLPANKLHPLDMADAGEANVLVRRGAVTAAIPNNDIPIGTDCVLVNLTEILGPGGK
jgi:hypothetical protein